jgi:predicted acetyltransferase
MTRPSLTFRAATAADVDTLAELSYHSFPMASSNVDARRQRFAEDPRVHVENFLVGEASGRVVTALHSIPFTTWVGGASQPMQGVAGVVVAPEGRRYGYASDLVAESMRRAREAGAALSALYPFRHGYYAALGYALAVEHRVWTFRPADLPVYRERHAVRRAAPEDRDAIAACYERVMHRATLMVERSGADWERRHFDEGRRFAIVFADGRAVRGYAIYGYKEFSDGRHTELAIGEIVYEDQEALRGLLGHVAALRDQFLLASCVTRASERFELRLANPREGGAIKGSISRMFGPRVLWGAMARVLDVGRALAARPRYNGATGVVRVAISDEQIPENRGPWALEFEEGRVRVSAADDGVPMGIGTFTQLYLGFMTAREAREVGLLAADDAAVELLDRAFAGPPPSLMDHF